MEHSLQHPEYEKFLKYSSILNRILEGNPEKNDHYTLFLIRNDFEDVKIKEAIIIFSRTNIGSDFRYQLETSRYLFECINQTKSFKEALISYQIKKRGIHESILLSF